MEAGNLSLAGNYRLEALDIELKAPQYELPLKESDFSNYEKFSNIFSANKTALEKLEKNGFVVVSNPYNPKEQEITAMYEKLKGDDKPIFITSDTLLHLYHVQFDESMSEIERKNCTTFCGNSIDPCSMLRLKTTKSVPEKQRKPQEEMQPISQLL